MADVMGAAAGYGMICLIGMLIAGFLTEIRKMQRETMTACGWVFLCCGLFAAAHYGIIMLIRVILYGAEDVNGLMDLVRHEGFARFYDLPEHAALYAMTASAAITAMAGCLVFFGVRQAVDGLCAKKVLILFYLLPGMGTAFLPLQGCLAALAFAIVLFLLCRFVRFPKWKIPSFLLIIAVVLFSMIRFFVLFRWVMGV